MRDNSTQQDVSTGGHLLWFGLLHLIMADTALTRDKDHCRRCDSGYIDGIVASAGDNIAMVVAEVLGSGTDSPNASLVKLHGW